MTDEGWRLLQQQPDMDIRKFIEIYKKTIAASAEMKELNKVTNKSKRISRQASHYMGKHSEELPKPTLFFVADPEIEA